MADASIVRLIAGPVAADRIGLRARFDGTAVLTRLAVDADMARLRGPDFAAGTVNLEARGSVGSAAPKFDGRLAFARASDSADLRRSLADRSEEHTSELQSLMRISYAVFCLKKKKTR